MPTRSAEAFGLKNAAIAQEILPVRLLQKMDAPALFVHLVPHVRASRPVIGERKVLIGRDKLGRKRTRPVKVYGAPTFRNVAARDGKVVGVRDIPGAHE